MSIQETIATSDNFGNLLFIYSLEEIEKAKRSMSRDLYNDNDKHDEEETRESVKRLNFWGLPWFTCPNTGEWCKKDCAMFTDARVWTTRDCNDKKTFRILGFECGNGQFTAPYHPA